MIEERQTTPRAVSKKIGDNPYVVRDILSGRTQNPRADTLSKIASELGVSVTELVHNDLSTYVHKVPDKVAPVFLPVRFKVQAGLWFEVDGEEPPEAVSLAVLPDPRYSECRQWLEKVVGDSANKRIPDGHYIHVVDAIDLGYAPKHGDWVVVVRSRDNGAIRERSVKQVEIAETGEVLLWPRSTSEKWQTPVDFTVGLRPGEEGVEVEIAGKVLGAYDPNF